MNFLFLRKEAMKSGQLSGFSTIRLLGEDGVPIKLIISMLLSVVYSKDRPMLVPRFLKSSVFF